MDFCFGSSAHPRQAKIETQDYSDRPRRHPPTGVLRNDGSEGGVIPEKRRVIKSKQLYGTQQASSLLGISVNQFRRISRDAITPSDWYTNPHYRSGPPCPLYAGSDIRKLKRIVKKSRDKLEKQSAAARKATATKLRKFQGFVDSLETELPRVDFDKLVQLTCDHYNSNLPKLRASPDSDVEFLNRITVNYLRHCCTQYENQLAAIAGKTGCQDAYLTIKSKVLDAIGLQYPELFDACLDQQLRMYKDY